MTPHEARSLLTAFARGRDEWLARTTATLDAGGLWLVGSLAIGSGDEWSDLDLIVVDGAPALGGALLTIDMPTNGPAGGGYLGAMYDVAGLPLWVDWYLWPAHAALPAEARLLAGLGIPGAHDVSGSEARRSHDLSRSDTSGPHDSSPSETSGPHDSSPSKTSGPHDLSRSDTSGPHDSSPSKTSGPHDLSRSETSGPHARNETRRPHDSSRSGTRGDRDLSGTLDHLGRGRPGPPPDPTDFALAMLPLAAKHLARGNHDTATSIATMLGARVENGIGTALADVLAGIDADHPAAALVRRHLTVVNAYLIS